MQTQDPYSLDDSKVLDPPTSLKGTIKHLGPGFILSASIVGSGELVATTQLGAGAGFVAMWVILVSCLVKVAVQLEFGKRAIMTGETTFASFNTLPGNKVGVVSFSASIKRGFMNYFNFSGRASRSEYLYFILFCFLLGLVARVIDGALGIYLVAQTPDLLTGELGGGIGLVVGLVHLLVLIPSLALFWRRMHDLDKSGSWFFMALTGIGVLLLLVWVCTKGTSGMNRFGSDPLDSDGPALPNDPRKAHWSIWTWLALMMVKFLQVGGIVGLVAVLLNMAIPSVAVLWWLIFVVVAVASIVISGYYRVLEIMSVVMIGIFTLFTLVSLIALQYTDSAIGIGEVLSGLQFKMPEGDGMTLLVIGAFGITGVGGDEIMAYNYWLIEKGYAANTGKNDGTDDWNRRAKGWIRVMYIDAIFAMAVYTIVTVAFFLLGCALLHGEGDFISVGGADFLRNLSNLYTSTLGSWAGPLFYVGAFVVLFSTAFSALGAWTRQFTDAFARIGLLDFDNYKSRRKCITLLSIVIPVLWGSVYVFFQSPVWMVLIGGFVTSIILLVVLYAAIIFKKQRASSPIKTGMFYEVAFWSSSAMILFVGIWTVLSKFL